MNKTMRKIGRFLLALGVLLSMSATALAYAQIEVDRETSLTLKHVSGSTPLSGADFRLYKVAEISRTNRYTLTEDFEKYAVNLEDMDSSGWLDLASTLAAYAARDGLEPTASGVTDAEGRLRFGGLSVGLYLVEGDSVSVGDYTYIPTPFMISLPNLDTGDAWEYDVTAKVKSEKEKSGGGDDTTSRSVVKVWKDSNGESRPESVTVQLLRDGAVYAEVKLSEENNWRYTWKDLSRDSTWQLAEKEVPDGYTVSVSREGTAFTVTNTGTQGGQDGSQTPGKHTTSGSSGTPGTRTKSILAQTGQLNWPIPLLTGCGLALFAAGWALVFLERRKDA